MAKIQRRAAEVTKGMVWPPWGGWLGRVDSLPGKEVTRGVLCPGSTRIMSGAGPAVHHLFYWGSSSEANRSQFQNQQKKVTWCTRKQIYGPHCSKVTWGRTQKRELLGIKRSHNRLRKSPNLKLVGIRDNTQEKHQIHLSCPYSFEGICLQPQLEARHWARLALALTKYRLFYVLFQGHSVFVLMFWCHYKFTLWPLYGNKPLQEKMNDKSSIAQKSGLRN